MASPGDRITRLIFWRDPRRARIYAFEEVAWQALAKLGDGLLP